MLIRKIIDYKKRHKICKLNQSKLLNYINYDNQVNLNYKSDINYTNYVKKDMNNVNQLSLAKKKRYKLC